MAKILSGFITYPKARSNAPDTFALDTDIPVLLNHGLEPGAQYRSRAEAQQAIAAVDIAKSPRVGRVLHMERRDGGIWADVLVEDDTLDVVGFSIAAGMVERSRGDGTGRILEVSCIARGDRPDNAHCYVRETQPATPLALAIISQRAATAAAREWVATAQRATTAIVQHLQQRPDTPAATQHRAARPQWSPGKSLGQYAKELRNAS